MASVLNFIKIYQLVAVLLRENTNRRAGRQHDFISHISSLRKATTLNRV
jgi:hypothetical protein